MTAGLARLKELVLIANFSPAVSLSQSNKREMAEESVNLQLILKELRDFRHDNDKHLKEIKGEVAKTNFRLDAAEARIVGSEERIQNVEDVLHEMLTLQEAIQSKLTALEQYTRRESIRIYGVPEGSEGSARSLVPFVAKLLRENLNIPTTTALQIQRAHRALAPQPTGPDAQPRSIVAKFLCFTMKEEVIKLAWEKKGFMWQNSKINIDHDYAPEILAKRKEYAESRRVLKANDTRFQTLYPARLRVHHEDGVKTYATAEDATADLARRGLPVTVIKKSTTVWERLRSVSWQTAGGRRPARDRGTRPPRDGTSSPRDRVSPQRDNEPPPPLDLEDQPTRDGQTSQPESGAVGPPVESGSTSRDRAPGSANDNWANKLRGREARPPKKTTGASLKQQRLQVYKR